MALIKGNRYRRADFGIRYPRTLISTAEVNGETYFFINIGGKYDNQLHNGGIIHEPRYLSEVVKKKVQVKETIHTFLRVSPDKDFEYIGDLDAIEPYDSKRNFLTFR